MDSRNVLVSNTTSPRQSSDTEMSSSCATSTASATDESDVRFPFQETIQAIRNMSVSADDSTNQNGIGSKSNGFHYGGSSSSNWVRLNVGGKVFQTTRSTLMRESGSFLYRLCQDELGLPTDKDETGAYLIDRDPDFFSPILNYLRHGKLILNPGLSEEGILAEADFYNLPTLSQLIMDRMQDRESGLNCLSNKFVYRVLQCHEEELASVVSAMTDGWKIVQVVPITSNYSTYTAEQPQEYLCIVERECPDSGTMVEGQDRGKLLQQRGRRKLRGLIANLIVISQDNRNFSEFPGFSSTL
ncbi:CRE-TAG-303 protein [Caenorhabditis remanei]|uniref:CRE-TAG-303 protein n=1 Tax=Caenorhabditis remanei TaxID=31234 RepID=E3MA08_CAERE|nr:CRE-TAG-303 protein [Caenorhabditis remanei]